MIEETGTIVAVEQGKIRVQTEIKTTCGSCHVRENCGTSVVAAAFASKSDLLEYPCDTPAQVGQLVRLGIPEKTLLVASSLVYMVPLATLILSAMLFSIMLPAVGLTSELWLVLASLTSTYGSFLWVSTRIRTQPGCEYQPRLLEIIAADKVNGDITVKQLD